MVQANLINYLIANFINMRYGQTAETPDKKGTENLAKALEKIGNVPPFSYVFSLFRKFVSIGGVGGTGDNVFAFLSGYAQSWYAENPTLFKQIYITDPTIPNVPFYPKDSARKEVGDELTPTRIPDTDEGFYDARKEHHIGG